MELIAISCCMAACFACPMFHAFFFFLSYGDHRDLHSFPTRRSSDLFALHPTANGVEHHRPGRRASATQGFRRAMRWQRSRRRESWTVSALFAHEPVTIMRSGQRGDRKSTRLNSSHGYISYAVFCLKK